MSDQSATKLVWIMHSLHNEMYNHLDARWEENKEYDIEPSHKEKMVQDIEQILNFPKDKTAYLDIELFSKEGAEILDYVLELIGQMEIYCGASVSDEQYLNLVTYRDLLELVYNHINKHLGENNANVDG